MIKGSLVSALLKHEIYKEYIYYAQKTMCEYSTFSEKMETLKVFFIKTEEEEEKGKEYFDAPHTISARRNILF
jgi:DNA replicative helicase MCM subunit Mcm2 (Cdc46/Mcm family)